MPSQSSRPRAADDFPTIRARIEELRRERARMLDSEKECVPGEREPGAGVAASAGKPQSGKHQIVVLEKNAAGIWRAQRQ